MFGKKFASTTIALIVSALPLTTMATPLTIVNNTDQDSTAVINGQCTSIVNGGTTKAHSTNVISDLMLHMICSYSPTACVATIFMNATCAGNPIGVVTLDINSGIQSIAVEDSHYRLTNPTPFTIQADSASAS